MGRDAARSDPPARAPGNVSTGRRGSGHRAVELARQDTRIRCGRVSRTPERGLAMNRGDRNVSLRYTIDTVHSDKHDSTLTMVRCLRGRLERLCVWGGWLGDWGEDASLADLMRRIRSATETDSTCAGGPARRRGHDLPVGGSQALALRRARLILIGKASSARSAARMAQSSPRSDLDSSSGPSEANANANLSGASCRPQCAQGCSAAVRSLGKSWAGGACGAAECMRAEPGTLGGASGGGLDGPTGSDASRRTRRTDSVLTQRVG